MLRRLAIACAFLVLPALSAGGCADPGVGGAGELVRAAGGGPGDHLILAGTPYEMGWWHGHLLKDRIRALHEEWQKQAFALDGDLLSPATKERRAAALALVEPVLQKHLPEEVRREYDGLAAGCGLPVRTLLLTEMITDILRFTEREPRLLTGHDVRTGQDVGVRLRFDGPWQRLLAPQWTWITRKTPSGRATTALTWPGSLGASLAARADGLVALEREEAIESGREGLAGTPFRVSLRRGMERADGPATLLAALARTTARQVLAVDLAKDTGLRQRIAMAGDEPTEAPLPPPAAPDDSMPGLKALHWDLMCATSGCFGAHLKDGATWVTWQTAESSERTLRVP
jgi:hypothetical protein